MSLSASLQWVDAPVAPHAVADAMAAALRPGDMANAPPKRETTRGGALRFRALAIVVIGHVALVGLGAFAWRESLRAPEVFEEIPVEIIVESEPARMQAAQSAEPVREQAEAPPPAADSEAAPEQHDTLTTTPETAVEAPVAAAQPAPAQPSTDDARARAEEHAEQERAAAQRRAAEAAEALAARQSQERAAMVVRERAAREARARAAQAAAERAELARASGARRRNARPRANGRRKPHKNAVASPRARRRPLPRAQPPRPSTPQAIAPLLLAPFPPRRARACSSGGGGRVVVALLIAPSGSVSRASVSSASGNATLDSAALSAVRRAGPFPAPSNRASVSVPVVVVCR
ncbi:MAG: TonB family protein [Methylobacteriaceae bacterium]|nr:TonB family protein [Methylobacteriaceae bacterium]